MHAENRGTSAWAPACSLELLQLRARLLREIRHFFFKRGVLEVVTPLLSRASGTEPHLTALTTRFEGPGCSAPRRLYLQTSPEFAMKRLLAAGSGSIYQICKAFRNGERGRLHNPEFTLVEWYRVGFTLAQLMDEVQLLITGLLAETATSIAVERVCYRDLFFRHAGLDPLTAEGFDFIAAARRRACPEAIALCETDVTLWLDYCFSHWVQPEIPRNTLLLVHDYPACQASLARIDPCRDEVAERMEVFLGPMELANGFRELTDAIEQERRFDRELAARKKRGLPRPPKDRRLLAALQAGLPDCSGVALGIDRLLMWMIGADSIDEVLAFPFTCA